MPKPHSGPRMSLESCYRDLQGDAPARAAAEALLSRRDWLYACAEFDQRTGNMLPSALGHLCARIGASPQALAATGFKDRLYRIVAHVDEPMRDILRQMHERLVRTHASLPVRAARELDSTSFFALSRRPGRTIREKLADRPYLLAVERRWTVDSSENRLVKALCNRLAYLLRARNHNKSLDDASWLHDFLSHIEGWLHSPAAREIGRWENLPPNNILLQHRDYRRLWDAWLWSQTLDVDLERDQEIGLAQWTTIVFWSMASRFAATDGVRLLEQPCISNYDLFSIVPSRCAANESLVINGVIGGSVGGMARSNVWRAPAGFCISLNPGGEVNIDFPDKVRVHVRFHQDGSQVRAQWGVNVRVVDLSANTAAAVAAEVVSSAFGALTWPPERRPAPSIVAALPRRSPFGVIDLCRLRPQVFHGDQNGKAPFRLLWQLWRTTENELIELDVGEAQAISLGSETTTISIFDLLSADTEFSSDALSRAARGFAGKVADAIPAEALVYIVPDATDEFALGTLRRSINSAFRNAEPLPRSVACVFAWQSSSRFSLNKVNDGDCVIVLDMVASLLSATFLLARKNAELERRVPESAGIYWERTPTVSLDNGFTAAGMAREVLEQSGCPFSSELARILGLDGLTDQASELSWQGQDSKWFTPPNRLEEVANRAVCRSAVTWAMLSRALEHEFRRLEPGARIHILFASDTVRMVRLDAPKAHDGHDVCVFGEGNAPVMGGAALHQWQARAGDIALWRDHLPELSMRIIDGGRYSRFYLVKDVTVAPRRGEAISIPIEETFVLSAGLSDYRFPLLQGVGGSALRYEAFLRAPAFPLECDIKVALHLTYTYGSDAPYDLVFKPVVETPSLNFVRAEWRLRDDVDDLPAHYPTLPPKMTWSQLARYPKRDSLETSDLLEWICDGLARVERRATALDSPRHTGIVSSYLKADIKKLRYFFAQSDMGSVFCHESEFINPDAMDALRRGDLLTLHLEKGAKGLQGRAIAVGSASATNAHAFEHLARGLASDIKRILRFPFLAAWSDARSLFDFEASDDFRKFMHPRVTMLLELSRSQGVFAYEALFLLCCMHADAPSEVSEALRAVFSNGSVDGLRYYRRHIALALGDCRLEWQRELLINVHSALQQTDSVEVHNICLGILGNAVWRCAAVLDALSNPVIVLLIERLIPVLEQTHAAIENHRSGWSPDSLKEHLELVLGLLRTRGAEDVERKGLLAPRMPTTKALARAIEDILDSVSKHDIPIHSRLALDVDMPPELSNTPELLYALKLYLTGDDGARAIRIVEVREDDREDA